MNAFVVGVLSLFGHPSMAPSCFRFSRRSSAVVKERV